MTAWYEGTPQAEWPPPKGVDQRRELRAASKAAEDELLEFLHRQE
jgi:hypothetical protein